MDNTPIEDKQEEDLLSNFNVDAVFDAIHKSKEQVTKEDKLDKAIEWCDEKIKEYDSKIDSAKKSNTETYFSGKANATNDVRLYLQSLKQTP